VARPRPPDPLAGPTHDKAVRDELHMAEHSQVEQLVADKSHEGNGGWSINPRKEAVRGSGANSCD